MLLRQSVLVDPQSLKTIASWMLIEQEKFDNMERNLTWRLLWKTEEKGQGWNTKGLVILWLHQLFSKHHDVIYWHVNDTRTAKTYSNLRITLIKRIGRKIWGLARWLFYHYLIALEIRNPFKKCQISYVKTSFKTVVLVNFFHHEFYILCTS